jgi:hypothetical protein
MTHARAPAGALWIAMILFGCGGKEIDVADGGGSGDDEEASPASDAAGEAGTGVEGYCLYQTCSGLSLCGGGQTCAVGDGCNTCTCTSTSGSTGSSSCTTNACSCH